MKKDLVVTRVFDALVVLAWKAPDPEQVMRWWGPKGFTSPVAKIDFRERVEQLLSACVHQRAATSTALENTGKSCRCS
jgi:uncharacterized protein YndB with AHSA1/START domain